VAGPVRPGGPDGAADAAARRTGYDLLKFIQIVFQNPDDSLNPRHTVAEIPPARLVLFCLGGDELRQRSLDLLRRRATGEQHIDRFRLSWRRTASHRPRFAAEPRLLLCDEVTGPRCPVQAAVIDR
jgi:peptide/nickel transport system ATP-binding protein